MRASSSQIVEEFFSKELVPQPWVATVRTPEEEQRKFDGLEDHTFQLDGLDTAFQLLSRSLTIVF
ncbi:hypothetical protein HYC85_003527 [Camellia sinensis]|uniref:Uncharacterized protein n=1 Tax=Camellia sinensis TaxID=4442 RepID=A0A7J7HTY5_CAMSI|nr:hypothetical protein HYC85_003527 [Camellia sinensis]